MTGHEQVTVRTIDGVVRNPAVDFGESVVEGLTKEITAATATSVTIDTDACGLYTITALATPVAFNAPTGNPRDGRRLLIRIKDNGSPQIMSWFTGAGGFRASEDTPLPSETIAGKTAYVLFIYNATDDMWDALAMRGNF